MRLRTRITAGFTLLEIILAMGVLMVGSLGALAVYRIAVDSHRAAEDQAAAALAAEGLLADYAIFCSQKALKEFKLAGGEDILGLSKFEFTDEQCTNYPRFYYDLRFEALPPEDDPSNPINIGQASEVLVTLRLKHYPDANLDAVGKDKKAYTFKTVFMLKPL